MSDDDDDDDDETFGSRHTSSCISSSPLISSSSLLLLLLLLSSLALSHPSLPTAADSQRTTGESCSTDETEATAKSACEQDSIWSNSAVLSRAQSGVSASRPVTRCTSMFAE